MTSANSTRVLGMPALGLTMAGPPPLEEAVGRPAQQFAELVPQRLGQVGVDLRGLQTGMAEQDLDGADVHALLEHLRGEAVTQRVRREIGAEATGRARLLECGSCGGLGQVGRRSSAGKEPSSAA